MKLLIHRHRFGQQAQKLIYQPEIKKCFHTNILRIVSGGKCTQVEFAGLGGFPTLEEAVSFVDKRGRVVPVVCVCLCFSRMCVSEYLYLYVCHLW